MLSLLSIPKKYSMLSKYYEYSKNLLKIFSFQKKSFSSSHMILKKFKKGITYVLKIYDHNYISQLISYRYIFYYKSCTMIYHVDIIQKYSSLIIFTGRNCKYFYLYILNKNSENLIHGLSQNIFLFEKL
jgi:hypothetical protein